jgi:uncharacterized protein (TIGR03435 family)
MASLRLLIQNAYGVQSFQITGGPDWMNSAGFDIEATAQGNPSRSQIWQMLRSLLEDRFNLKVHKEAKVMPVYVLTPAKSELKLLTPKVGGCVDSGITAAAPALPCGDVAIAFDPATGLSLRGREIAMAELIKVLSMILQRPVLDKTAFPGRFDADLRFAYDQDVTVGIGDPWRQSNVTERGKLDANPPITDALEHQLGLKLQPAKGPVEVLVIDHADKPTEN